MQMKPWGSQHLCCCGYTKCVHKAGPERRERILTVARPHLEISVMDAALEERTTTSIDTWEDSDRTKNHATQMSPGIGRTQVVSTLFEGCHLEEKLDLLWVIPLDQSNRNAQSRMDFPLLKRVWWPWVKMSRVARALANETRRTSRPVT